MEMMIDPSIQLAESGAASAMIADSVQQLSLSQLFTETPVLATVVSESSPPTAPVSPRLSDIALTLSEAGGSDLRTLLSQVDFGDPASLIALTLAAGQYKAETSAASGIAAAEANALKTAADKLLSSVR